MIRLALMYDVITIRFIVSHQALAETQVPQAIHQDLAWICNIGSAVADFQSYRTV